MFNVDKIGHWGQMPICSHQNDQNHTVLHLKLMRVHFRGRVAARIVRPVLDLWHTFNSQDSYDHLCIFVDIKCKECGKQTVYTLEFQRHGPRIRRGYYMSGARESDQLVCSEQWQVQWKDVVQLYNQVADSMGRYSLTKNNCQNFTRLLWPKLKQYAWDCQKQYKSR